MQVRPKQRPASDKNTYIGFETATRAIRYDYLTITGIDERLRQTRCTGNAGQQRDYAPDQQTNAGTRQMGNPRKDNGNQRRSDRLTDQTSHTQHSAGAPAAMNRSRRNDREIIRRLEESETGSAQHNPPKNIGYGCPVRQKEQQKEPRGKQHHPDRPQDPRMIMFDQASGQRGRQKRSQRPGSNQQSGFDRAKMEGILQKKTAMTPSPASGP